MKKLPLLVVLFCLAGFPAAFAASETAKAEASSSEPIYGAHPNGVFAFPGKECPLASHPYKGPEQREIQKTGYNYCVFDRRYVWFRRTADLKKCPDGKDFVEATTKEAKYVWCDMPYAQFSSTGLYMAPGAKDAIEIPQTAASPKPVKNSD